MENKGKRDEKYSDKLLKGITTLITAKCELNEQEPEVPSHLVPSKTDYGQIQDQELNILN